MNQKTVDLTSLKDDIEWLLKFGSIADLHYLATELAMAITQVNLEIKKREHGHHNRQEKNGEDDCPD